jgi:hypothetical protein
MRFWFHYNKPASKKVGRPQITIHFNKQCCIVDNLVCNVKTFGRTKNQQPYFVIAGDADTIEIKKKIAYIK